MPFELKILLVEDDESLRQAIFQMLSLDYHLCPVATLAGARAAIRTHTWDVVLLDLGLPDGNGLALFETLRQLPVRPVVIVLTGYDDLTHAKEALAEGADDYVVKTGQLLQELSLRIPLCAGRLKRVEVIPMESTSA